MYNYSAITNITTVQPPPQPLLFPFQDLVTFDEDDPEVTFCPGPLDGQGRLAAVSHLLAALVTTLDPQHLRRLASRIMSDTCLWVSRLFRCKEESFVVCGAFCNFCD